MGEGGQYICSCGYRSEEIFYGVGFLSCPNHPFTIEDVKGGKYGDRAKEILESNPEAVCSAYNRVYTCTCGNVTTENVVFMKTDVRRTYPQYVRCGKCGKRMRSHEEPPGLIPCPECGKPMLFQGGILWD